MLNLNYLIRYKNPDFSGFLYLFYAETRLKRSLDFVYQIFCFGESNVDVSYLR